MAKHPVTMAVRALRAANVAFEPHLYPWHAHGGTRASAEALGVDEHAVVKTLIFEDEVGAPLCILMHGDREVSTKQLARLAGLNEPKRLITIPCGGHRGGLNSDVWHQVDLWLAQALAGA